MASLECCAYTVLGTTGCTAVLGKCVRFLAANDHQAEKLMPLHFVTLYWLHRLRWSQMSRWKLQVLHSRKNSPGTQYFVIHLPKPWRCPLTSADETCWSTTSFLRRQWDCNYRYQHRQPRNNSINLARAAAAKMASVASSLRVKSPPINLWRQFQLRLGP